MAAGPSFDDRDPRPARGGGRRVTRAKRLIGGADRGAPRPPWLRALRLALALGLLGVFAAVALLVGIFSYYGSDPKLPNLSRLDAYHPKQVTRILDRNGAPIGELGAEKRTVVAYADIPKRLVEAVVSAEDADYFQHGGLDYRGMARALIEDVLRGRRAQGGSTITQQVVKTMLLSPERTLRRKVQEIILARQLTQKLSKEDVLALYLNQIYYGHGRYGCEEAARYFFGKSVRDIDLAEAALLAGLPQSPERLSPRKHPDAAKTRQRYVLGQMAERGFIDRATADKVAAQPIRLVPEPVASRGMAAEAVDLAAATLVERLGDKATFESGTTVTTTIDAHLQELARTSLERGLEDLDARLGFRGPSGHLEGKALAKRRAALASAHGAGLKDSEIFEGIVNRVVRDEDKRKAGELYVDTGAGEGVVDLALEHRYAKGTKPIADRFKPGDLVRVRVAADRPRAGDDPTPLVLELGPQAAMVVLDPTNRELLALVGGYDFHAGGFDRAVRARRQPGSAFKAVLYGAAAEAGKLTPATLINDSPDTYKMGNSGDLWKPENYEKDSYRGPVRVRTAFAESLNTVAIKVLDELGVPQLQAFAKRVGVTSAIDPQAGLSLALGSLVVTPVELANVYATFASGGLLGQPVLVRSIGGKDEPKAELAPALKPEIAYIMVSLMRSVIDEGTAHAGVAGKLRRPAAGKTGTTSRKPGNQTPDTWFVGFTPDLLAAVWIGFDDGRSLGRKVAAANSAVPIWTDFMVKATAGRPSKDFVQPPGIVVQRIDKASGQLAATGQDTGTLDEVFVDGTAPTTQAPAAGEEASPDKLLLE
jgi:penicillin-binding protein 1A